MRPTSRAPLLGAVACFAGLVLTGALSHLVHAGEARDAAALTTFSRLRDTRLDPLLHDLVHLADTVPYLIFSAAIVGVAMLRARPRTAIACAVVLVCAPASAEVIKHITAEARQDALVVSNNIASASWPSGHASGAMAMALCAVLVSPAAWRPLVALIGGLVAIGVGYSVVALVWHFPSDTIGGFFLAATWTLGAVAVLRRHPDKITLREAESEPGEARRRERAVWLVPVLAVGLLAAAALLVAFSVHIDALTRVADYPSGVAAAVIIAALGALLSTVLALSARSG